MPRAADRVLTPWPDTVCCLTNWLRKLRKGQLPRQLCEPIAALLCFTLSPATPTRLHCQSPRVHKRAREIRHRFLRLLRRLEPHKRNLSAPAVAAEPRVTAKVSPGVSFG